MADISRKGDIDVNIVDGIGNINKVSVTSENRLGVDIISKTVVSTNNSSISTLGISGVFTGTWEDILNYAMVSVQVYSSHASATDGLSIQWSSNGTNIDDDDVFTIPASNGKIFTFNSQARYFRIVYTNGVVAQTAFRLHTLLKVIPSKPSSHRIGDTITTDEDAELMCAVLTGEDSVTMGTFNHVKTNASGRLLVSQETVTPPDSTNVSNTYDGDVSGTDDQTYLIPTGEDLYIQNLLGGGENDVSGNVIRLYYDPNGNGTGMTKIIEGWVNGSNFNFDINAGPYTGNGTIRIRLRRERLGGGAKEIFARWEGYY